MTADERAAAVREAQWLLHGWTEPAFARTVRHVAALVCARNVLALAAALEQTERERDEARRGLI